MLRSLFTILFATSIGSLFSQIDSLKNFVKSAKLDTSKADTYIKIAKSYYNKEGFLASWLAYFDKAAIIYKKNNLSSKLSKALNGKGLMYREMGEYKEALDNCFQALSLSESVKDR